jgi:hypothetical protein
LAAQQNALIAITSESVMKRILALMLLAVAFGSSLSGCIIVPVGDGGGYYHHYHPDYYYYGR